jgi:hypothetical protein
MGDDEGAGKLGHRLWIGAEAPLPPADDRVRRIGVEVNHGAEIEVDAGAGELLGHAAIEAERAVLGPELGISSHVPRRRKIDIAVPPCEPLHEAPS